jgi:hypothetical protein
VQAIAPAPPIDRDELWAPAELIETFDADEASAFDDALELIVERRPEIAAHRPAERGSKS